MKYILLIFLLISLSSCGVSEYYNGASSVQLAQIEAWENQRDKDRADAAVQRSADRIFTETIMVRLSNAARTTTPMDDMTILQVYGQYQLTRVLGDRQAEESKTPYPRLAIAERPNDFVDGVNAFTPWISLIAPWWSAYKMVDAVGSAAGVKYTVGGDMAISSPDSFNPSYIDRSYIYTDSPVTGSQ